MPSKNPDLARIRDNQRRSRARRKSYLRELEEKLREYELRGIQASSALQIAAKDVVRENAKLRSLLRLKGATEVEIETYLQQPQTRGQYSDSVGGYGAHPSSLSTIPSFPDLERSTESLESLAQSSSFINVHCEAAREPNVTVSGISADSEPLKSSKGSQGKSDKHTDGLQNHGPSNSVNFPTERLEQPDKAHDNMTACVEAAKIIVSMNHDVSIEEANAKLGCKPANDCFVDNLKIFQIIDR